MADDADVQETIRRAAPSLLPVFALLTPVERADLWHAIPAVTGRGPCSQSPGSYESSPTHAEHCARRYVAVYERGGWYVDSDASCVRPFDKWAPPGERADLVVGVEAERWPGHYQPVQVCSLGAESPGRAKGHVNRISSYLFKCAPLLC